MTKTVSSSSTNHSSAPRVRFAPSPTGFLHVGGARSALFNWFYARHFGGTFVLRIEDTDTERNRPEFEEEILRSMKWLGIEWHEGPFYQSQRFDVYRKAVQKLLDQGLAYRCYCTTEELDEMRAAQIARGEKAMYDRRWRDRTELQDKPFVIRFKTPLQGELMIPDLIKGDVRIPLEEIDDFVILRSNNVPTYNFTVVVDDIDMQITHVIRGEEHLNNAPKQILLMKAMGLTPPLYAHVPLILAPDKTKLSKRHGAVAVSEFFKEGYLPEALTSTLMRLGWSHGDQEIFTSQELEQFFNLDHCGSSGAVFDKDKLNAVNAHFIKLKTTQEIVALLDECFGKNLSDRLQDDPKLGKLLDALKMRAHTLKDIMMQAVWYLGEEFPIASQLEEEVLKPTLPSVFPALCAAFEKISDSEFHAPETAMVFKSVAAELGLKMPQVAKPARVVLTGNLASPDIGLVCEVLGKSRVLARLKGKLPSQV